MTLANLNRLLLEGDESGWMQMLVYAVIFGLMAVSQIVKSRKQKRRFEEEESAAPRPAPPAGRQGPSRAVQQRPAVQPVRRSDNAPEPRREVPGGTRPRTIIRPGSALSDFVADIKAEIKRAAEEMQGVNAPPPWAIAEPEPPQVARPMPEPDEPKCFIEGIAPEPEIDEFSGIAPEFSDPDDLKRAVLYYEILGKPISMRGQADHIIGLY